MHSQILRHYQKYVAFIFCVTNDFNFVTNDNYKRFNRKVITFIGLEKQSVISQTCNMESRTRINVISAKKTGNRLLKRPRNKPNSSTLHFIIIMSSSKEIFRWKLKLQTLSRATLYVCNLIYYFKLAEYLTFDVDLVTTNLITFTYFQCLMKLKSRETYQK